MKQLLAIVLLASLAYGGYVFYLQSKSQVPGSSIVSNPPSLLTIKGAGDELSKLGSVLSASIESSISNGKEMLSSATSGASDPIINQLISNTTETLKDLPQKQAEKIKYEFCRSVVTEYENK